MSKKSLPEKSNPNPFASKKFSPESLQDILWEVLQQVKKKDISPSEANAVTMAAKEICNVARLQIQYRLLEGHDNSND